MQQRMSALGPLGLLLWLSMGACGAPAATQREERALEPDPTGAPLQQIMESSLIGIAVLMARAAPNVSRIWLGFWPEDQGFLLLSPMDTALLVSTRRPPETYVPLFEEGLPPELKGRAYLRQEYPPELDENAFRTRYGIGHDTVPALQPKGSTLFERLDFYYHESFHGFQQSNFAESPAGDRRVRFREHLVDPDAIGSPEFGAMGEVERRVLAAALSESRTPETKRLVRDYLAVRHVRTETLTEVRAVERSFERWEGTAEFVGCSAAALAIGASCERARSCILSELTKPLNSLPNMPEADARLMRWRQYGTGASMAALLDRFGVEDWQGSVKRGAYLDDLLAEVVGFEPNRARMRAQDVLEEFGYEELLRVPRGEAKEGASG